MKLLGSNTSPYVRKVRVVMAEKRIDAQYELVDVWSPDSARIAFETRPTPEANDARHADIAEVEVAGGAVRELAATPATESDPLYSPDGRYLAFLRSPSQKPNTVDGERFVLLSREDGRLRELPATPDERPRPLEWSPDSRSVYFYEPKGVRNVLYRMPLDGPPFVDEEELQVIIDWIAEGASDN